MKAAPPVRQAILFGYYGARNLGDELMLVCLRQWFATQGIEITVGSQAPEHVEQLHGGKTVLNVPLAFQYAWRDVWLRGKALRLIRHMWNQDLIVAGGGDFIRDDRGWKPFSESVEKLVLGILMSKPVCLVNVGIGRPKTAYGKKILAWTLKRCSTIIVRDQRSYDLCCELGAGRQTILLVDIVMCLQRILRRTPSPKRIYEEPYILVCLRGHSNVYGGYEMNEARVAGLAAGLDAAVDQHNCNVVFLPFQSDQEDDNVLHNKVAGKMRYRQRVEMRPWHFDVQELLDLFYGASCVVAMRLHAAILALSVGHDCVVLPYDHKVLELCRQMNLDRTLTAAQLEQVNLVSSTISNAVGAKWHRPATAPSSWDSFGLSLSK
jgi:polysaccharide pyruvyl transferase CsaB